MEITPMPDKKEKKKPSQQDDSPEIRLQEGIVMTLNALTELLVRWALK